MTMTPEKSTSVPGSVSNPGRGAASEAAPAWAAPVASGPLVATTSLPGSKSLTNRVLILAALSATPTRIAAPLRARATSLLAAALRNLGVNIIDEGSDWVVQPGTLRGAQVDCGLAGTVMRFVPPVAALADGTSYFDGDPHARTRPMSTLIDGLRQAGVVIEDRGAGLLPFRVIGRGAVSGGVVELDASSSSQFVSALLLAGARFEKGIEIQHVGGALPSLPHIEMTIAALRAAGVQVDDSLPNRWQIAAGQIDLPDTIIEPDLSNAAPFLGAALVAGGSVTVRHWPLSTTQAGDALRFLLAEMGASVRLDEAGLTVTGAGVGEIRPLIADLHDVSELTPVIAALCALASGESRLSGVAHIRGHETDRLAAVTSELNRLGGEVEETDDGLIIRPAALHGGLWRSYADHRMAQAGALLGVTVTGLVVDDIASTTKTMSDFPGLWASLVSQTETSAG
jgi:3-phosphoshikimate 1-carboxyvinyltransferase